MHIVKDVKANEMNAHLETLNVNINIKWRNIVKREENIDRWSRRGERK